MKIGIFDSGIGGLALVNQLVNTHNAHIVYVADTANMPYGDKSPQEIINLSEKIVQFLLQQDVDCIIIACHTISAIAAPYLVTKYKRVPFINMLDAVIPAAAKTTLSHRIGVMATPVTIESHLHKKSLEYIHKQAIVFEQTCPSLAYTIEHYQDDARLLEEKIKSYCTPLLEQNIDTLILGCTHYDIIKNPIKRIIGDAVTIIASDTTTPSLLQPFFQRIATPFDTTKGSLTCYVSNDKKGFGEKLFSIVDIKTPVSIKQL